ncbi:MAG: hypothetical protein ACI840_002697, partial [Ulvibacter sp.]
AIFTSILGTSTGLSCENPMAVANRKSISRCFFMVKYISVLILQEKMMPEMKLYET